MSLPAPRPPGHSACEDLGRRSPRWLAAPVPCVRCRRAGLVTFSLTTQHLVRRLSAWVWAGHQYSKRRSQPALCMF